MLIHISNSGHIYKKKFYYWIFLDFGIVGKELGPVVSLS